MPHCIQANTKHLYNVIYTMSDQRQNRWVDVYKCYKYFVYAGICNTSKCVSGGRSTLGPTYILVYKEMSQAIKFFKG